MTQATTAHLATATGALEQLYTQRSELNAMLQARLGKTLDQLVAADLPLNGALFLTLTTWALSSGRFVDLVHAVWEDRGQPAIWKALFDEFPDEPAAQGQPPPSSPWDVWRLNEDEVFLDRKPLRAALRKMIRNGKPRVIVVRGDAQSGKSYTHRLVEHVTHALQHRRVWIDMMSLEGGAAAPLAFANTLLMSAGLSNKDIPAVGDPSADKLLPLVSFVIGRLRGLEGTWWFVLDRCARATLSPAVWGMLFAIVTGATNSFDHVHFLLLGVDEETRPLLKNAGEDRITPIGAEQVREFLAMELAGRVPPVDPERIDREAAAAVLGVSNSEDEPALAVISERAIESLRRLAQGGQ